MERIDFKIVEILKRVSKAKMNYVSPINLLSTGKDVTNM